MEKGLQHITHVWPEGGPNSPGTGGQDLTVHHEAAGAALWAVSYGLLFIGVGPGVTINTTFQP